MPDITAGLQWKISLEGAQQAKQQLADLVDKMNQGKVSTKEFRSEIRNINAESTEMNRIHTASKNIFIAEHPALTQLTNAFSSFSGVANTALSISNAINLGMLVAQGASAGLQDAKQQETVAWAEYARVVKQFGANSAQAQEAYSKAVLASQKTTEEQRKNTLAMIQNDITLAASVVLIGSSVLQTIPKIAVLTQMMGGFSGALTDASIIMDQTVIPSLINVGRAALGILGPIAIVAAAIEGVFYAFELLDPQFKHQMDDLQHSIESSWNTDAFTAALLTPFVALYAGIEDIGAHIHGFFVDLYNDILINIINPIIEAYNSSLGQILGKKADIPTQFYHMPTISEALKSDLGINLQQTPGGGDPWKAFAEEQEKTTESTDGLVHIWTNGTNPLLENMSLQQALGNQTLIDINTQGQAAYQLAQAQLDEIRTQKNAQATVQTAMKDGIDNQTKQLEDLKKQYSDAMANLKAVDAKHAEMLNNSPNATASDFPDIMAAIGNVNSIQSQIDQTNANIAQLQTKSKVLDNQTSGLTPILSSLGLSADTGIGSIISGALGNAAGIGGAGITADQIAEFVRTHDYGVFTKAAIGDSFPNGSSGGHGNGPTDQEQINDLAASLAKNLGVDLASHPYLIQQAHDTLVKGKVIKAATGFDGMVSSPTSFMAGEGGAEHVSITPANKSRGGGGPSVTIHVAGSILTERDLKKFIDSALKDALKRGGW